MSITPFSGQSMPLPMTQAGVPGLAKGMQAFAQGTPMMPGSVPGIPSALVPIDPRMLSGMQALPGSAGVPLGASQARSGAGEILRAIVRAPVNAVRRLLGMQPLVDTRRAAQMIPVLPDPARAAPVRAAKKAKKKVVRSKAALAKARAAKKAAAARAATAGTAAGATAGTLALTPGLMGTSPGMAGYGGTQYPTPLIGWDGGALTGATMPGAYGAAGMGSALNPEVPQANATNQTGIPGRGRPLDQHVTNTNRVTSEFDSRSGDIDVLDELGDLLDL